MRDETRYQDEAGALIPEIVANKDAKLAEFIEAHRRDIGSFRFECRRHGDFLAVFLTRGAERPVAAINMMASPVVAVVSGYEPDMKGTCRFERSWNTDRVQAKYGGEDYPRRSSITTAPIHSAIEEQKRIVLMGGGYHDPLAHFLVIDTPRRACDDIVTFGNGTNFNVPAGSGSDVFASIMIECERVSLPHQEST